MLTNQEILDKAVGGLLTQNARSTLGVDSDTCMYRGAGGLKCAVGQLIPDNLYTESMENIGVRDLFVMYGDAMSGAGLDQNEHMLFLSDLQRVHDGNQPSKWRTIYKNIGERMNLNTGVCNAN